jgi:hypothetical protein
LSAPGGGMSFADIVGFAACFIVLALSWRGIKTIKT